MCSSDLNNGTLQSIFGVGITLSSSTIYDIEAWICLLGSGSSNSVSASLGFGGTATVNNIIYQTNTVYDAGLAPQVDTSENMGIINTTTQTTTTAAAICQALSYNIRGTVSVNAGGTFIPNHQWSGTPGAAWVVQAGSYFSLYPVGVAGANVSVGTWA